jgi:hypothetical protein
MDEVYSKLIGIFQNVNEWLKFAEAKNGILLAFSGAGITATITLLATAQNIPRSLSFGVLLTTILLCICSLICSLSFLPKTNLERLVWLQIRRPEKSRFIRKQTDNFYYFGHLYKYSSIELLDALNQHYFEGIINIPYKKEYEDIAGQITINSEITFLKFQVFTYAIYILIASILVIPISIIISLVIYRKI